MQARTAGFLVTAAGMVTPMPYFLAKHAFVCAIGPDVIVLDLKQDKYLAFQRTFWEPIVRNIGGWPVADAPDPHFQATPDEDALAQLIDSGLLTADSAHGKDATPAAIDLPSLSLMEDFRIQPPTIRAGHVLNFLRALCIALLRLRFQRIETLVESIRAKRRTQPSPADMETLRDLTEIFRRLRPLLFTSRDHCLFESLTLLHFLGRYRIHPTWVFGVQTAPFAAHCWLQSGTIACNDPLDHIRRYTPIMLV